MNADTASSDRPDAGPIPDRWAPRLINTLLFHTLMLAIYSATICGCHFSFIGLIVAIIPTAWAGYSLFTYRTRGERIVAWINLVIGFGWLVLAWDSHIRFLFRRFGG
jgi:hypothetical protein